MRERRKRGRGSKRLITHWICTINFVYRVCIILKFPNLELKVHASPFTEIGVYTATQSFSMPHSLCIVLCKHRG